MSTQQATTFDYRRADAQATAVLPGFASVHDSLVCPVRTVAPAF